MKKYLLFILVIGLFLIPNMVSAKTYNAEDFNMPDEDKGEVIIQIVEPGDTIKFDNVSSVNIYIDEKMLDNCYGTQSGCTTTYEVTKRMVYSYFYRHGGTLVGLEFKTIEDNANIISLNDLVDGHIYKSGDYIAFPFYNYEIYYYDANGNNLFTPSSTLVHKIDQMLDENDEFYDATYKLSIIEGTHYSPIDLAFQVYDYVKPSFRLECDKDTINYGEKTTCSFLATSMQQLKEVSFSLDFPNFKVSNVKAANHVTKLDGQSQYRFRIENGYGLNNTEFRIMTFNLEGTKNENYVDDINITNINYKDNLYEGNYDTLQSNLRIHTSGLKNPDTYRNLALILLPIIILAISLGIVKVQRDRKKKI